MKNFCRRFLLLFLVIIICTTGASAAKLLIPGGQVIGLNLCDGQITQGARYRKVTSCFTGIEKHVRHGAAQCAACTYAYNCGAIVEIDV